MKLPHKISNWIQELITLHKSPHEVAFGFSVGTFIAVFPTPGFGFLAALFALFIYPKMSKIALFAALIIWNPITLLPFYAASYYLGDILFGGEPVIRYNIVILNHLYNFTRRFLIGNIIVSLATATASYLLIRYAASKV